MDAITHTPSPAHEPVPPYPPGGAEPARPYAPGGAGAAALQRRVAELAAERRDLPMTIAGRRRMASGERIEVVQPHNHKHVLGETANASAADVADAVAAAKAAAPAWRALPFDERAAVILRAADLLSGPWRDTVNAATLLGQSKSVQQAEIDSACEL